MSAYKLLFSLVIHVLIIISVFVFIRFVSIFLAITDGVKAGRRYGYFVKIDEFKKLYQARFVKNLLEKSNIPCFLEGYYYRSLLYLFGPFVEISLKLAYSVP